MQCPGRLVALGTARDALRLVASDTANRRPGSGVNPTPKREGRAKRVSSPTRCKLLRAAGIHLATHLPTHRTVISRTTAFLAKIGSRGIGCRLDCKPRPAEEQVGLSGSCDICRYGNCSDRSSFMTCSRGSQMGPFLICSRLEFPSRAFAAAASALMAGRSAVFAATPCVAPNRVSHSPAGPDRRHRERAEKLCSVT